MPTIAERPTPSPPGGDAPAWHALPAAEALARQGVGSDGLTAAEAGHRLAVHGPNALTEGAPIRPLAILAGQFKSLLVGILIVAAGVSWWLGERTDAIAILAIVVLNAGIGFYQEYGAERAIAALRRMTAPRARVRRAGAILAVPATEVVPGDILLLEAGDRVPADARLLEAANLGCVEAALTGESDAARKRVDPVADAKAPLGDRRSMVHAGTSVATGSGLAVVVATGMATELGRIAGMLAEAHDEETPLQRRLAALGRALVLMALGIVALIFVLGLARGLPLLGLFVTSVSLAVAAVPEGLPAVVTIALAIGVRRMARRHALIRRLPAVETLGATNVIATDKTGTLTVGEMTARELWLPDAPPLGVSGEGYAPVGAVAPPAGAAPDAALMARAAALVATFAGCVNAALREADGRWEVVGDPTEGALLALAGKLPATGPPADRLAEHPFDPERKRMTVVRGTATGPARALVKGAPDMLLERCSHVRGATGVRPLSDADRAVILAANTEMGGRALRVLAAATRELPADLVASEDADAVERELTFEGLVGLQDPPRPEAKAAIARCREAGIRVVMITGDHPATALAIAGELGLTSQDTGTPLDAGVLTGAELDALDDAELARRAPGIAVYARVSAAHKLRVVRAWRANEAVIAMTGDGVNDAPAIKGANVGVAMGRTGTEVTKEASDMIVADDNFASIVAAVEEGRGVYANIKKTLQYLLAGNAAELLFIAGCVIVGLPMPLAPIHLLWINLVTDGLPALALATDPLDPEAMRRPPRDPRAELTDRDFLATLAWTGVLTASAVAGTYVYVLASMGEALARTSAFAVLVYAELLRSFGARSDERTLFELPPHTNMKLVACVALGVALQPWNHHQPQLQAFFEVVPMGWGHCAALLAMGMLPLAGLELRKLWRRRGRRR